MSKATELSPLKRAFLQLEKMQKRLKAEKARRTEPIAIVGMGCRLPAGGNSPEQLWQILASSTDAISEVPADRWDIDEWYNEDSDVPGKMATRWGGFVKDVDQFEPQFFNISPREAASLDPQQRILLETTWEALERAGHANPAELRGSKTGVFVAMATNDYSQLQMNEQGVEGIDMYFASGAASSMASGRLSYVFGLHGPSISIDTACSSSLVGLHLACKSLRDRECDQAITAGVNLIFVPENTVTLSQFKMMAPDGHCKTFDETADGFVRGEGAVSIVLKRLSDAERDGDNIMAVVRGSAVNQDGPSSGLTAPNGPAQEALLREALKSTGLKSTGIDYIEAHGTGTSLGDPIEVQALGAVYGEERTKENPLLIGSVKTNMGHLEAAAGVTGIAKAVLMLQKGLVPPHLNLENLSSHIPWSRLPIEVPTQMRNWPATDRPRRAGVSSFGFSGTNAHIILEQAPEKAKSADQSAKRNQLVCLSANDADSLKKLATSYADFLADNPNVDLKSVSQTTIDGRAHFMERLAIQGQSASAISGYLRDFVAGKQLPAGQNAGDLVSVDAPKIVFMFTGQGSQSNGMGKTFYQQNEAFKTAVDQCAGILSNYTNNRLSITDILFDETDNRIHQTEFTQPALFVYEYAMAQMWQSFGVTPAAAIGHSVGEYVAAVVAGLFSLEDGLKLIVERGRLMTGKSSGTGAMVSVTATENVVADAIAGFESDVSIAAVNSPNSIVISGYEAAVAKVVEKLSADDVQTKALKVSHGFHSPQMDAMLDEFEQFASKITFLTPQIRLISNVTGEMAGAEVKTAKYWCDHVRGAVRFADGLKSLLDAGFSTFLEVGPHPVLSGIASLQTDAGLFIGSAHRSRKDWELILESAGRLYLNGASLSGLGLSGAENPSRVVLPTYPFNRSRYWIKTGTKKQSTQGSHPLLGEKIETPMGMTIYKNTLSASDSLLAGHDVYGKAVLPGAGYFEMALVAANALNADANKSDRSNSDQIDQPVQVEGLSLQQALQLDQDESRSTQFVVEKNNNWTFYSQDQEGNWLTHAGGKLVKNDVNPTDKVNLESLKKRAETEVSKADHYQRLTEIGIKFGEVFRGVETIHRGENCALGELKLPAIARREAHGYTFYPALLDAALQIVAWTKDTDTLYMPIGIETITLYKNVPEELVVWAEVEDAEVGAEIMTAALTVMDSAGGIILKIDGLKLKRAPKTALQSQNDDLIHVTWPEKPLVTDLNSIYTPLAEVAVGITDALLDLAKEHRLDQYDVSGPKIALLCAEYILVAADNMNLTDVIGDGLTIKDLAIKMAVEPEHHLLFGRFMDILAEENWLSKDDHIWTLKNWPATIPSQDELEQKWQTLHPEAIAFEAEMDMVHFCGPYLDKVLLGHQDPVGLLFPNGSAKAADRLYSDTPFAHTYNGLVKATVTKIVANWPENRPLRVLEVGGGTGGTTTSVLESLPAGDVTYTFTDIGPLFVTRAKEKFAAWPMMKYQVLDLEKDFASQGLTQSFDLIIAANVVHATKDMPAVISALFDRLNPGGVFLAGEGVRPLRWIDITFGMTEGWWRFDDHVRTDYPLILPDAWHRFMNEIGFSEVEVLPEDQEGVRDENAVIIARKSLDSAKELQSWMILSDDKSEKEIASNLVEHLTTIGDDVFVADTVNQVAEKLAEAKKWAGIIDLRALNAKSVAEIDENGVLVAEQPVMTDALDLAQAVIRAKVPAWPKLMFVTADAIASDDEDFAPALIQSPLWGLNRVLTLEHPELKPTIFDFKTETSSNEIAKTLFDELKFGDDEEELILRDGKRKVRRLSKFESLEKTALSVPTTAYTLELSTAGVFDQMRLLPVERPSPSAGQVEIEVVATGLNFRDIMNALAMRDDPEPVGAEIAGRITAVGENVVGLSVGDDVLSVVEGGFNRYVLADSALTLKSPKGFAPAEAVTIPLAFMTAWDALVNRAKLQAGETILIHAAAGGVGMAAVQIAHMIGATVIGTAGSPRKHARLHDLGVKNVFSSRELTFLAGVKSVTAGKGVNVVLNSLAGDFIEKSIDALDQNGRFVEIGKRDVWTSEQVNQYRDDVDYMFLDLSERLLANPIAVRPIFEAVLEKMEKRELQPLPRHYFDISHVPEAFRFMAQAKHIGKIVVLHEATSSTEMKKIIAEATYFVSGGLSGLGLLTAQWLVKHGAKNLILMGRRGAATGEAKSVLDEMIAEGVTVNIVKGDVSRREDILLVKTELEKMPPLRGIFHSAGVLDDGAIERQDWSRYETVLKPKMLGAWWLHTLLSSSNLDWFVLYSSASALLGSPGESNHAAANVFMDMLAHYRRRIGLPAVSINWGAWAQVGAAVRHQVEMPGMKTIAPDYGMDLMADLSDADVIQCGVMPADWEIAIDHIAGGRRPALLSELVKSKVADHRKNANEEADASVLLAKLEKATPADRQKHLSKFVQRQAARVLALEKASAVHPAKPLSQLGLDSLMSVELRNALSNGLALDQPLPATLVFDYPTVNAIAEFLGDLLFEESESDQETESESTNELASDSGVDDLFDDLLSSIESMSDDEADGHLSDD